MENHLNPNGQTQNKYYDNTMLSAYKDCPRKYFIRHMLGWRSEGTATPLAFGLAWHAAQDVVWVEAKFNPPQTLLYLAHTKFCEAWSEEGLPVEMDLAQIEEYNPRTPSIAKEMLVEYIEARWRMLQEAELLACEQPFAVPVPDTENIWYIGRLDKVVRYNGQVLTLEHKTTTEYKKDGGFRATYIDGWYSDSQIKGYQYGAGLFFGVEQVWVDAALVHKTVHNAFRFVPVAHQLPLLQEWINDTTEWINRTQRDVARYTVDGELKPGTFPKNENSCVGKFGPCPYLNICRTTADPSKLDEVPPGYIEERWIPFEILGIDRLITQGAPDNA